MSPREARIRQFIAEAQWQYRKEMPESLREGTWMHAFDDIHLDRLDRAMKQILGDSKYFPQPADIKELARGLQPSAGEIADREERRRQNEERLMRGIEAANQKLLKSPTRSILLENELSKPKRKDLKPLRALTQAEGAALMAEWERQKNELLRIDTWGKQVTKHATPIPRDVPGGEAEFLLFNPEWKRRAAS